MPIPLLWIAGVAVTALATGITVAYRNYNSGKRLAILGARHTGKTTLYTFLTGGDSKITTKVLLATNIQPTPAHDFRLENLSLNIKQGTDIGGGEDLVQHWDRIIEKSDYTFYMVDVSKLFSSNSVSYIRIIENHLGIIKNIYVNYRRECSIKVIGVFCDEVAIYRSSDDKFRQGAFRDSVIEKLQTGLDKLDNHIFLLGSLENSENREILSAHLLKSINAFTTI